MLLWYTQVAKHKFLEVQLDRFDEWDWFSFKIEWTRKRDHAGFEIYAELVGFVFILNLYDHRHWDYDNNRWETPT